MISVTYVGSLYEIESTLIFTVLFNFNNLKGFSFLAQDFATLNFSQGKELYCKKIVLNSQYVIYLFLRE